MDLFREANGTCPTCDGLVNIVEGMVYDYLLDEEGYPETMVEEQYKVTAYCANCHKQLFAIPRGFGYTITDIDIRDTIEQYRRLCGDQKRVSAIGNILMENYNPFSTSAEIEAEQKTYTETDILEEDIPF